MAFNGGFTTQGIAYITGSDGQILTWSDVQQAWVAADAVDTGLSSVSTTNGIIGDGTPGNPVSLDTSISVQNLTVTQTASIAHLDTLYQQSLIVGDKYITILSGANTHASADGSGFLWGSGSTDGTTGDQGSVAYALYRNSYDKVEIFPGLRVSGSVTASAGFSGSFVGDGSDLINVTTKADHVIYVAASGSDSNDGSIGKPFATISGALAYANTKYPNYSESVMIEVGPGTYSQNLTLNRYNTYVRSTAHRQEQRAVAVTGKTLINSAAGDKYNRVIGFQGIFFNHNSLTNPTVNVSGSTHLTYFKDCYFASNGANAFRVENVTTSSAKIVLASSIFLGQKGGADIISINGGDVKIDTIEVHFSSVTGSGNGINQTGNSVVAADRVLVDLGTTITGSSFVNSSTNYTGNPTLYLSNASLGSSQVTTNGALYSTNVSYLWNVTLANNSKIKGNNTAPNPFSAIVYSDLTSVNELTFETITRSYLKDYMGDVNVNSITSSLGFSGRLYGTASYALDAGALGGIATSSYARKDLTNTFSADQIFDKDVYLLGSDVIFQQEPITLATGDIILNGGAGGGGNIQLNGGGDILLDSGDITVSNGNLEVTYGTITGDGSGISNLSSSNWHDSPTGFASDVRSLFSASGGVNYNSGTGVISVDDFLGVETSGSITGSGLSGNPIKLKDNITAVSVTATNFYGTASYAQNSNLLDGYDSNRFAITGSNTFNGNQTVNGRISASTGITGSFNGDGSQVTNLTGSNWNGGTASFYQNVASAFTGSGIDIVPHGDGRYELISVIDGVGLKSDGSNILGTGRDGDVFRLSTNITSSEFTASSGFTGRLYGSSSYSLDSDKLDGLNSTQFATTSSNTFNGNQTVNGSITASSGITGSFKGNGSQLTNLTASGWNNNETGFYSDVQDAFIAGSGVNITQTGNKYTIEADIAEFGLSAEGGITGSGTSADPFILQDSINITNDITASNVTASNSFYGNLLGTASYASEAADSLALNGYSDTDFALLNNDVQFTTVTASFSGDGSEITGLSSSQIQNFSLDVSNIFVAGNNISIEDNLNGTYTISSSQTLTGSDWSGGTGSFYQDVRSTFTAAGAISISSIAGGRYEISSSGGSGGGGGLSTVETSGSITGSGDISNPVALKPDIKVNSIEFGKLASDPVTHVTGQIWYNSTSHELRYATELENIDISLGRQIVQRCYNAELNTLTKGTIVRISGPASGDAPSVSRADWTSINLSSNTLGIIVDDIQSGEIGYMILEGILKGYDTNSYNAGDSLYLSSSGQITNIKPQAPKHLVSIGQVMIKNPTNGYVYVHASNGYELDELHDVNTDTIKTDGDLLVWDDSTEVWTNTSDLWGNYTIDGNLSASNGITSSIGFYSDPNITSNIRVVYADSAGVTYDPGAARTTTSNTFNTNSVNTFEGTTRLQGPVTASGNFRFTTSEVLFTNNIRVNGTASIGLLNTISQSSLQVGDKYITIMSGASDHTTLSGSGILWGSGSNDLTTDENGAAAHITFDSGSDRLEIFPGLNVIGNLSASVLYGDGSGIEGLTTSSFTSWSSDVRSVLTGSNGIAISAGTASLSGNGQLTSLTASSHISASNYYGNGSNLSNITAEQAKNTVVTINNPPVSVGLASGKIVSFVDDGFSTTLAPSSTTDSGSNAIGILQTISGNDYSIVTAGKTFVSGASSFAFGTPVYVDGNGTCTNYAGIPSGGYITQIGYVSYPDASGEVILQFRVFGQKA